MSNFASIQTYQGPIEETPQAVPAARLYQHQGANSVSIRDGEVSTSINGQDSYQTSNLAQDTHGDNWKGTARNRFGNPTTAIDAETLVTIDGMQFKVKEFVAAGRLKETAPGVFEEASATPAASQPESTSEDVATLTEDALGAVNEALSPVPDHALDGLLTTASSVAAGLTSVDQLVSKMVRVSGVDPEDAKARVETITATYQAQADGYLTSKAGIAREDLAAFYESVKAKPGLLHEAIRQQVAGDFSGWNRLAYGFTAKTAPSVDAVNKAGYPTRNISGTPEVFIGGMWASVKGAARAGLL